MEGFLYLPTQLAICKITTLYLLLRSTDYNTLRRLASNFALVPPDQKTRYGQRSREQTDAKGKNFSRYAQPATPMNIVGGSPRHIAPRKILITFSVQYSSRVLIEIIVRVFAVNRSFIGANLYM